MDLTRAIRYRGFDLNKIMYDAVSRDMVGCEVRSVEYGSVVGVGYEEKRAMGDGTDVADLYLGKRIVTMTGNVYGRTRAEAFEKFNDLADVMTPTDAYEDSPVNRGYVSMDFYMPTTDTTYFPSGLIHAVMLVRPMSSLSARFDSDVHGGDDDKALAIPWTARLDARVPDIVNYDFTTKALTGDDETFSMRNRGNRPARAEVRLVAPPRFNDNASGYVNIRIRSDSFRIRIPPSSKQSQFKYDTHNKVLTRNGDVRMDLITLNRGGWHPKVPPGNVAMAWARTSTKPLRSGSYLRFRDTWA